MQVSALLSLLFTWFSPRYLFIQIRKTTVRATIPSLAFGRRRQQLKRSRNADGAGKAERANYGPEEWTMIYSRSAQLCSAIILMLFYTSAFALLTYGFAGLPSSK